jgi:hypothetical protein
MNGKEKIMMAIWMMNKLIDRHREVYTQLKEEYLKEKI